MSIQELGPTERGTNVTVTTARIFVFIAALSWSTAGLFTRVVSTDVPTTLFGRSLSGGACVGLVYLWSERPKSLRTLLSFTRGEVIIALLSALGMVFFISAFFYTSIANVSFVYGAMPLVTLALSVLVFRERADLRTIVVCSCAAIGIGIIFAQQSGAFELTGLTLAALMTLAMSSLTIAARFYADVDVTKATYLSAFLACLATAPFMTPSQLSVANGSWLALYGIVNVGLGFGLYLIGASRVQPVAASLIGLVEIPLAPLWAWIFFHERVGLATLIGGAVVLASVVGSLMRRGDAQTA